KAFGLASQASRLEELTASSARQPVPREEEMLWRFQLYGFLRDSVGGKAGAQVLPAFRELADIEQNAVLQQWQNLAGKDLLLEEVGINESRRTALVQGDRNALSPADLEILWQVYLYKNLKEQGGENAVAAEIVRDRLKAAPEGEAPVQPSLADHGILG